ncbi:MAG: ferredoxin--nitrite reductase [Candidatus Omnitrophica bacterium CG11_big_fil_rev_8_21_14_0_20_64_10]|nr:MAG: ferredoxin--nitrite reductase [Candidatus Omnitrophica bacterium CG11_big_fil_rev_8_21_14_0_20_64_10]
MADNLIEKRVEEYLRQAPDASQEEIRQFRELVEKYFLGELDPNEFKARRLHMGTYGIRATQDIHMMRIKIPMGKLTPEQLEALADVAEKYSKGVGHITTRQAMQVYWVPTRESAYVMARCAAVGLTTREACGNSVRNVTASPFSGVDPAEAFDVTAHAAAVARFFLRNEVSQKLPRKFKIALESSPDRDLARTAIHDIGAVAEVREVNGKKQLGFRVYAGGGLGAAPMQAILLEPFTPVEEFLRTCEALVRIHDRLGNRKSKAQARLKFVVKKLGEDAFRKEVFSEREKIRPIAYPEMTIFETDEKPPKTEGIVPVVDPGGNFARWKVTNVISQKQTGFSCVAIRLRLGDITSEQMRGLAKVVRKFCGGYLRAAITQNLVLRWVRDEHLGALYRALEGLKLAEADAERLLDVTSCPGAETCQLGISASRGLARALEQKLREAKLYGEDIDAIRIKVSGCPNSCGQHHIADIGFFGGAAKVNGHLAPHFNLLLGGRTAEGVAEFGKPVLKLPARRIPEAVIQMLTLYRKERLSEKESFRTFNERVGLEFWKEKLQPFATLPDFEQSPEAYRDWGAETDFSLAGMGPGECAA